MRLRAETPSVIVVGNEKGGSGKSTTTVHLAIALAEQGHRVATLDLDARQGTLTRYLENRHATMDRLGVVLPMPEAHSLEVLHAADAEDVEAEVVDLIARLREDADYVVVDTPGHAGPVTIAGHTQADILVTPINDSFIDLDLLAHVNAETLEIQRLSTYAETVFDIRKSRARQGLPAVDWVVVRNRISSVEGRNTRNVTAVLDQLERRLAFRQASGFGERMIFRDLFLQGLTLLDLKKTGMSGSLSMAHVAARQELRSLLRAVGLAPEKADKAPSLNPFRGTGSLAAHLRRHRQGTA